MKKQLPVLTSDEEAEDFVANCDLTEYDLSKLVRVRFEFKPNHELVELRLPEHLVDAVQERARRDGISFEAFVRMAIDHALQSNS